MQVKRKCCVCFCPLHVESVNPWRCAAPSFACAFLSVWLSPLFYLPLRSIPSLLSYITALSQVTIQPRRCAGLQDNCTSSPTLLWLRAPLKLVVDFSTCSVESTFFFFFFWKQSGAPSHTSPTSGIHLWKWSHVYHRFWFLVRCSSQTAEWAIFLCQQAFSLRPPVSGDVMKCDFWNDSRCDSEWKWGFGGGSENILYYSRMPQHR